MKFFFSFLFVFVSAQLMAQQPEVFSTSSGAINGYDVVAYFTESRDVKGNPEFVVEYQQTNWYFSSAENKKLFQQNPDKYLPQYGGYCAFGMSNGYKAPTTPDAWTIIDGKLYLNYNTDVRKEWQKNTTEFIQKADTNWPAVKGK